jgi:hypothetical protein
VSLDNSQITPLTNHFSDIVVSTVKYADLEGLNVDTGFLPGYDDWQFTNYGSFIAQGGHCAGQSITAMWYFQEKYEYSHYPRLYGEFDNYDYPAQTNAFWRDDSEAYRFASVVQETIDWEGKSYKIQKKLSNLQASMTMYAFIYAMEMTGEPQFVEIWGIKTNDDGTTRNAGHAIIAYRVENNQIYVADPNYPGVFGRVITFNGAGFDTYSSGSNSAEIEAGKNIPFTDIYYIAQSSLIDYGLIEAQYVKMLGKTVGDDTFPTYKLEYLTKIDQDGKTFWAGCPEELTINSAESARNIGEAYRNKIRIAVTAQYKDLNVALYSGLNDAQVLKIEKTDDTGTAYFDVELTPGINDIGFYVYHIVNDAEKFIGFTRVRVDFDLAADMKFAQDPYDVICQAESTFEIKVKDAPPDVTYMWDFGDGSTLETEEPVVDYTYTTGDEYTLTCTMVKNSDGKVLSEARATVSAVEIFGTWNLNYTITEAGGVNYIANFFGDLILGVIRQIFPDQGIPETANINIEGTVVSGVLNVYLPENGDVSGKIPVELIQQSSSTDYVDVNSEPLPGYLTINKDQISIVLIGSPDDDSAAGLRYEGYLSGGRLYGTFSAAGLMSGTFEASR